MLSNPIGNGILLGRTMKLFNVGIVGYGRAAGAHLGAIDQGKVVAAARVGKHLIVKKPLALSLADMRAIEVA